MTMNLDNDMSCDMIVDRKNHVQYPSFKGYLDDCTCSLDEQNIALNDLYNIQNLLFKKMTLYSML